MYAMIATLVRMPKELLERVKAESQAGGYSQSHVVRTALYRYLKEREERRGVYQGR